MADVVFNSFKAKIMDGTIDLDTDTIKMALLNSAYSADQDAHENWDDVSANEISGSGYTAGGETLSGASVSIDDTDNEGVFDVSDVTWNSATIAAAYAVVYMSTSQASTSPLVCVLDFSGEQSSTNADFKVQFNAEGLLNLG